MSPDRIISNSSHSSDPAVRGPSNNGSCALRYELLELAKMDIAQVKDSQLHIVKTVLSGPMSGLASNLSKAEVLLWIITTHCRNSPGHCVDGGIQIRGIPCTPRWVLRRSAYQTPVVRYSWMEAAALRPAPMARITVAPPVTMSPPAKTPGLLVRMVSGSATM